MFRRKNEERQAYKNKEIQKWLTEELKSYNFRIATQFSFATLKIDILQSYFQKPDL